MNTNEPLEDRIESYEPRIQSGNCIIYFNVRGPVNTEDVEGYLKRNTVQPVEEGSVNQYHNTVIYNDHGALLQFIPED